MDKVICSIFDMKAGAWLVPMFFLSVAQAARSFEDAMKEPQGDFFKHPEDYILYKIGDWDERNGVLRADEQIIEITRGMNAMALEVVDGAQ